MITYETFSTLMQESGVHNQWEYQELYDRRIVPKSVPRDPAREYKRHHPKWRSFNEAKKFVHALNISDFKDKKLDSLKVYESVFNDSPEIISGIISRARFRGSQIGVKLAEAFEVIKDINL